MGQCLTSQSTKPNDQAAAAEKTREAIYAAYNGDGTTGPTFDCEICIETTTLQQSFNPKGCKHFYCNQCTAKYIETELSEKSATQISCPEPGCEGLLDPDHCREILPAKLLNRWETALVDSAIDVSEKVYCPYSDCTVLSIDDKSTPRHRRRGFVLRGGGCHSSKRKCPNCKRKMCVKCECAWHDKMTCETYQKLNREGEEKMMELLAKLKRWKKCPVCKYYVARRSGCNYIKCRYVRYHVENCCILIIGLLIWFRLMVKIDN
ncbi:E3 ubiquitin-protein ligase RSL1 [Linum perenne]